MVVFKTILAQATTRSMDDDVMLALGDVKHLKAMMNDVISRNFSNGRLSIGTISFILCNDTNIL
jgi:hypothetical protein